MFSPDTSAAAVSVLLRDNPEAYVAAIDDRGFYLEWPASLQIGDTHPQLPGRSLIHAVIFSDRTVVIEAWDEVKAEGISRTYVSLLHEPESTYLLAFFDLRAVHDVLLAVLVRADDDYLPAHRAGRELHGPEESVVGSPRIASIRKDEMAVAVDVDDHAVQMLGMDRSEIIGRRSLEFIHPDDHDVAITSWMEMLSNPGLGRRVRLRHRRGDGSWLWVEITNTNLLNDPEYRCVLADVVDITEEMAAHQAVRDQEQLLRLLAESLPVGVFQIDTERRLSYSNARLHDLLGRPPGETIDDVLRCLVYGDRLVWQRTLDEVLVHGIDRDLEVQIRYPEKRPSRRRCTISLRAVIGPEGSTVGAVGCVQDVTDAVRLRNQLEQRATYDHLTGCLNRSAIMQRLEGAREAQEVGSGTAVIFVDLDGFKAVNDRYGHASGDQLLIIAAERLRTCVRDEAVGRLGGDEFLVVCQEVPDLANAQAIAQRVSETLHGLVQIGDRRLPLRASVGLAWTDSADVTADDLLAEADAGMYENKRHNRLAAARGSAERKVSVPEARTDSRAVADDVGDAAGDGGSGGDGGPVEAAEASAPAGTES